MSDPATTEITGPTIVDPNNPDLDYSYCASDRRHVVNVSVVARTPQFQNKALNAVFGDWQVSPLVRWQSGDRSIDHARRRQRADRPGRAARGADPRRSVRRRHGRATISIAPRSRRRRPAPTATLSAVHDREPVAAAERSRGNAHHSGPATNNVQFRWEIFNVINHVNYNAPTTALNSANFGKILTAGDPRIMQFALKVDF